jgi:hypothetical protein
VVRALSQTTTDTALTPIEIPGAPTSHAGDGDITAPALRRLEASNVELSGSDNLRTWMGASPQRIIGRHLERYPVIFKRLFASLARNLLTKYEKF